VKFPDAANGSATRSYPSRDLFHLLAVVVAVAAIAALYFARIVLIPFALALLFTFILTPVVRVLERVQLRRIPSTLLVVLLSVAAYFFIVGRYGIKVGDRITISSVTGDVIDVGLVRFYMMELAGPDSTFTPCAPVSFRMRTALA